MFIESDYPYPRNTAGIATFLEEILIFVEIALAFHKIIYYYWNQAREATPTKARLTS